ncbi:MAG TPA: VIT1/CCC1 transporter family protein [Candidatus Binataceae bacterium]|nr:VIT1/CCC1 transporter family protein [Candidatus Binataceae bacterium]
MAPTTAQQRRARFQRLSNIREVVFGMQDGILTTAGVLCGLAGALPRRYEVILTALASTAAGAISMAAGAYLGTRAEGEVLEGELNRARDEVVHEPYLIQEDLLDQLGREGLSREAGYRVVKLLSTAPEALTKTAEEKVYGIGENLVSNPITDGIVMGLAFVVGALVPLVPFVLTSSTNYGLGAAVIATAAALFGVGYFEGWLADRTRWLSGAHFLAIALGAALAGFGLGKIIGWLSGVEVNPLS